MIESISVRLLLFLGIASIELVAFDQSASAHTFSGDESASFLALVKQLEAQLNLVQSNIPSNITLAQQHANQISDLLNATVNEEIAEESERVANELTSSITDLQQTITSTKTPDEEGIREKVNNIDAILQETVSIRIEEEQLNNSTINGLTIYRILGETVEHYRSAFEMKGQLENNNNTTSSVSSNNNTFMINLTEYQTAQAFAQKALDTFNETKENPATNSLQQPAAITELDDSLGQFKNAIDNKDSYDTVFRIAEYQVVPNLQTVFNLKTKS
ncbi:MAG: hypothetical protein WAM88_14175 [Nitrososphaeraceae archaeon]